MTLFYMGNKLAFLDMEFGHIHGTKKLIYFPIELGIVVYDPKSDEIIETISKHFSKDIEVEKWRNNTNEIMMTIQSSLVEVANLHRKEYDIEYDKNRSVEMEEIPDLLNLADSVYNELGVFLRSIKSKHDIQHCFVYGGKLDILCIRRSGYRANEDNIIDVQEIIKKMLKMYNSLSLDRTCFALNVKLKSDEISSDNFRYELPKNKKGKLKDHNAIGDAGRIFLAYKELKRSDKEVKGKIRHYFKLCREYREQQENV